MKRIMLSGLLGILALYAVSFAETPAQPAPAKDSAAVVPPSKAKLYTDEVEFAFGWMPSNATVTHPFWMHSQGEDSLRILSVKPG